MPAAFPADRLLDAQTCVRRALENWNAGDLECLDRCRGLLEQAAGGMSEFEANLRAGELTPNQDMRAALVLLKQDVRRATRIVDAGAAFHRGLAARLGSVSPGYDAGGRLFSGASQETRQLEDELHG
jgi:hypothetical protein